ncbi:MAG: bifunctional diaminohydroxyphosphoribosylaminopyrimidine deaminase/5-amino-6-(5-phosphoribosylamino)uracil reductase RibD, partial [Gaiellaceae bacterium]
MTDEEWLVRALELAERGRGTPAPNPVVGAVLVRDGALVGEGWHERAGGPHAEVVALEAAGERARGATLYVTLEPCAHTGRVGPCAEAIIAAGVRRVVAA